MAERDTTLLGAVAFEAVIRRIEERLARNSTDDISDIAQEIDSLKSIFREFVEDGGPVPREH